MDVLVPFDAREPKTRLRGALEPDERDAFARAMLRDVCEAVASAADSTDADGPTVLSTAPLECPHRVVVDDRPLTEAVDARLDPPVAVVMADLPLVTPRTLERLFEADGDVVLAPGLGGGTNAMVVRAGGFHVDYHGASIRDHRRAAREAALAVTCVDSFRLAVDVDERADLAEVLLHADGRAAAWLRSAGFEIDATGGRVTATR